MSPRNFTQILAKPLIRPHSPNPTTKAVEPPSTDHETTLEKYRKEEKQLLKTAVTPVKTTKISEFEKPALGFEDQSQTQGVSKSIDHPWKHSPIEDNFLGGWGDDF